MHHLQIESSMKIATEYPLTHTALESQQIEIPFGLIGLAHLRSFEVTNVESGWPFVNLRSLGDEELNFLAIEPYDVIPGYEIELSDEEAETLGLHDAEDALIYNIVTVHASRPQHVTVNLIGPVVVNRRTLIGKQVIIANGDKYSTTHALIDERCASNAA